MNSIKYKSQIWASVFIIFICIIGVCWNIFVPDNNNDSYSGSQHRTGHHTAESGGTMRFRRDTSRIDYSSVMFDPWDVSKASAEFTARASKPYTIMVYMNGSDLESKGGAATDDLVEMLESGLDPQNANIIIFTGGTNRWQNRVVPTNNCVLWEIAGDRLIRLAGVGLVDMGNPGTLTSFIDFSVKNFPAEKYGLILWDHGGGSIAGYGHDEKFGYSSLSLLDMNYAFSASALADTKLEFLGFDTCLMASVEMAVIAAEYARYMIASEDLVPKDGWDYGFLSVLNDNPHMSGAELGIVITDYFMEYYGEDSYEELNMAVVDLAQAAPVMNAMGNLMIRCSEDLLRNRSSYFRALARKRSGTKTFGVGSPRDNESDMVDIADMAGKLSALFPRESAELLKTLDSAVIYNRNNSDIPLGGLSTYYIYGGRRSGQQSLNIYYSLLMDDEYTNYLHRFWERLTVGQVRSAPSRAKNQTALSSDEIIDAELTIWETVPNSNQKYKLIGVKSDRRLINNSEFRIMNSELLSKWPMINAQNVCLYKISETPDRLMYAIPAKINGHDADIIVLINRDYPNGKILGARNQDGFIIQKGYEEIKEGDWISFYYEVKFAGSGAQAGEGIVFADGHDDYKQWEKGREFTVKDSLKLEWGELGGSEYYCLRFTDIVCKEHYAPLRKVDSAGR